MKARCCPLAWLCPRIRRFWEGATTSHSGAIFAQALLITCGFARLCPDMPSSDLPREDHGGPWPCPCGTNPDFATRSYVFRMTGVMVALRKREGWPRKMLTGSGNADRLQEARWLTVAICRNRDEWVLGPCDPNDVRSGLGSVHWGEQRPWQHLSNQPLLQRHRWEQHRGGWYLTPPAYHVAALPPAVPAAAPLPPAVPWPPAVPAALPQDS